VLLVDTSTYHYKSRRHGQAPLEQRIKEICQTRVRYGYRRVAGQQKMIFRFGMPNARADSGHVEA
jgi:hypothetical protein